MNGRKESINRDKNHIEKDKQSLDAVLQHIEGDDHFREVTKMVVLGSGAKREVTDYMLTRYACYLIAQNGEPKKECLNKSFIHKAIISPFNRNYFKENAKGSQQTMPKINQECVVNTNIPLPPLAEQTEIVRRVETQLDKITQLEQQIATHEELTKQLMRGILRDAFKGER